MNTKDTHFTDSVRAEWYNLRPKKGSAGISPQLLGQFEHYVHSDDSISPVTKRSFMDMMQNIPAGSISAELEQTLYSALHKKSRACDSDGQRTHPVDIAKSLFVSQHKDALVANISAVFDTAKVTKDSPFYAQEAARDMQGFVYKAMNSGVEKLFRHMDSQTPDIAGEMVAASKQRVAAQLALNKYSATFGKTQETPLRPVEEMQRMLQGQARQLMQKTPLPVENGAITAKDADDVNRSIFGSSHDAIAHKQHELIAQIAQLNLTPVTKKSVADIVHPHGYQNIHAIREQRRQLLAEAHPVHASFTRPQIVTLQTEDGTDRFIDSLAPILPKVMNEGASSKNTETVITPGRNRVLVMGPPAPREIKSTLEEIDLKVTPAAAPSAGPREGLDVDFEARAKARQRTLSGKAVPIAPFSSVLPDLNTAKVRNKAEPVTAHVSLHPLKTVAHSFVTLVRGSASLATKPSEHFVNSIDTPVGQTSIKR